MFQLRFKFPWSSSPRVQLTAYRRIYASLGLSELTDEDDDNVHWRIYVSSDFNQLIKKVPAFVNFLFFGTFETLSTILHSYLASLAAGLAYNWEKFFTRQTKMTITIAVQAL